MNDPPDRVARLSFVQGAVSVDPADAEEWIDATLNRPVTSGDRIWVDADSRAELQVGTATIHLDEYTGFSFTLLDDGVARMSLTDGAMALHVQALQPAETLEIDTPNATVMIRAPGEYSIDTEESGDRTTVKTRTGRAEVTGSDQHTYPVDANEQGVFTGNDELSSIMTQVARRSAFETWASERENLETHSVAARYVSSGVVGYQDLDRYGTWTQEPEYGNVWQPTTLVVSNWAPYRFGRWVWVSPWGWTWIDDSPWGFAPFHYGRWTYLRQRWCWVPGPIRARPSYAPALVAWVGPPSFGVDFRTNVGWFPLGPREIYIPARHTSWQYFNNVNSANAMFVDNNQLMNAFNGRAPHGDYRNRAAPHAVTVVDRDAFIGAHHTGATRVEVDADDLRNWRDQARPPNLDPNRDSLLGARPSAHVPPPHRNRQRDDEPPEQSVASAPDEPEHAVIPGSGSAGNVGQRPGRLSRPNPSLPVGGDAFASQAPADAMDNSDAPDRTARDGVRFQSHRDAPAHPQHDRPPQIANVADPADPAPPATQVPHPHRDRPPQADRPPKTDRPPLADQPSQTAPPVQPRADRPTPADPPRHTNRVQGAPPPAGEPPRVIQQTTPGATPPGTNDRNMAPAPRGTGRATQYPHPAANGEKSTTTNTPPVSNFYGRLERH